MLIKQSAFKELSKDFYIGVELSVLKQFLLMILIAHFGTQKISHLVHASNMAHLTTEARTLITALLHSYTADRLSAPFLTALPTRVQQTLESVQSMLIIYVPSILGIGTLPESPLRVFGVPILLRVVGIFILRKVITELSVSILGIGTLLEFFKSTVYSGRFRLGSWGSVQPPLEPKLLYFHGDFSQQS